MQIKYSLKNSEAKGKGNTVIISRVQHAQGSKKGQEHDMVFEDVPADFAIEIARAVPKPDGQRTVEMVFQELADDITIDDEGLTIRNVVIFDKGGELVTLKIHNGETLGRKILHQIKASKIL